MPFQVCPQHVGEELTGLPVEDPPGSYEYTCTRSGHVVPGPITWLESPPPPGLPGLASIAQELSLQIELPAALQQFGGRWVEYGVLESAYAAACPNDFAQLVDRYGHRYRNAHKGLEPSSYTVSMFVAGTLGHLAKQGYVAYHLGPATGYWAGHLETVSWWALPPGKDWSPEHRLSCADAGTTMDYALVAS